MTYASDPETARNCDRMMLHSWRLSVPDIYDNTTTGKNDQKWNDQNGQKASFDHYCEVDNASEVQKDSLSLSLSPSLSLSLGSHTRSDTWGLTEGRMWFQASDPLDMYLEKAV